MTSGLETKSCETEVGHRDAQRSLDSADGPPVALPLMVRRGARPPVHLPQKGERLVCQFAKHDHFTPARKVREGFRTLASCNHFESYPNFVLGAIFLSCGHLSSGIPPRGASRHASARAPRARPSSVGTPERSKIYVLLVNSGFVPGISVNGRS